MTAGYDSYDSYRDLPASVDRGGGLADRYQPLDWHEVWTNTPDGPDWLVPDILERGRSHALVSPAKAGKSLLTLDIVAALVTGRPLLGRPNPNRQPVVVLYIDVENSRADLRERLGALGYGPDDLSGLRYYSFPFLPALDSGTGGITWPRSSGGTSRT